MNRRHFLLDATQVGVGWRISGPLLDGKQPFPQGAKSEAGKARSGRAIEEPVAGSPVLSLDGEWQLAVDSQNVGRAEQWYTKPLSGTKATRVPGIIHETYPNHHGVFWYQREFTAPLHPQKEGRYLLRFGAVDYLADVWVNGSRIGGHEGRETPFTLDATQAVKPGAANRLTVRVLNTFEEPVDGISLKNTPHPGRTSHYTVPAMGFNWGGIWQSVELLVAPAVRVQDIFVRPDSRTGKIRVRVHINNTRQKSARARLQFAVGSAANGTTLLVTGADHELPPGETPVDTEIQVENRQLWDISNPFLYRLTARLRTDDGFSDDETSLSSGFRDLREKKG